MTALVNADFAIRGINGSSDEIGEVVAELGKRRKIGG